MTLHIALSRKGTMLTRPAAAMLMLVTALPMAAHADAVADFYRGRTVNLIVGYGPGGGYDLCARLVARHHRPVYSGQSRGRGAEHAGRRQPARDQLSLRRRAE